MLRHGVKMTTEQREYMVYGGNTKGDIKVITSVKAKNCTEAEQLVAKMLKHIGKPVPSELAAILYKEN